jgi:hypothetical protein
MRRRLIFVTASLWVAASVAVVLGSLHVTGVNDAPASIVVGLALGLIGLLVARWLWAGVAVALPAAFVLSLGWLPLAVIYAFQAPGGQLLPLQIAITLIATCASLLALLLWVTRTRGAAT